MIFKAVLPIFIDQIVFYILLKVERKYKHKKRINRTQLRCMTQRYPVMFLHRCYFCLFHSILQYSHQIKFHSLPSLWFIHNTTKRAALPTYGRHCHTDTWENQTCKAPPVHCLPDFTIQLACNKALDRNINIMQFISPFSPHPFIR